MDEHKINAILKTINELCDKYEKNTYIIQRLETHLLNLPNLLELENKKYEERINRVNDLILEQDNFYKIFLSKHQYYFMPFNNIYYEYDGKTYKTVKDDDIHYNLLSTITDGGKLIQWKHKTKQIMIKKIKERTLLKSTPETFTIQNVLSFVQTMFETKTEAKYFLTIIGDCILKKNTENLLYFISPAIKKIIALIDSIIYITTGYSITNNFITKYHESHKLTLYRLLKTTETNLLSFDIVKEVLNNIGIDLFCVATHYSERYGSADNYINSKMEPVIKNHVLYFNENTQNTIVDDFINQCIDKTEDIDTNITWKNIHYIWKLYLSNLNIPSMIYTQKLQDLLMSKLTNKVENSAIIFTNVTSKYLPNVSSFLLFWDKHITINSDTAFNEYEIDELVTLYKNYDKKVSQISDVSMIKMICHFYSPNVEIIDNKYVTNIECNLWSKTDDINDFLQSYKCDLTNTEQTDIISIDDIYQQYKNYINAKTVVEQKMCLIVSKQYFEKFVTNHLSKYIKFDKFVSLEWVV